MARLAEELQRDALNESVNIMSLLNKAKAVSVSIKDTSISAWIDQEINGYKSIQDIPEYRQVVGSLVCYNPINGHIPLSVGNPEVREKLSTTKIAQPLGVLCDYAAGNQNIVLSFNARQSEYLTSRMQLKMEPGLEIQVNTLKHIIYSVRARVVNFASELLSHGIDRDVSDKKEENPAASPINYTINIGSMTNSQIQQGTTNSHQNYNTGDLKGDLEKFISDVTRELEKIKIDRDDEQSLKADFETIKAQLTSSSPKKSILRECLISTRTILEGAAGGVLASYIPATTQLIAACI